MTSRFRKHLATRLDELREGGLYKHERVIASRQGAEITLEAGSVQTVQLEVVRAGG